MAAAHRFADLRRDMVENQLRARGVRDPRLLDAMGRVPREEFVPHDAAHLAYADHALAIGAGQTISQPYVVAVTLEAARIGPDAVVLDVGAGSGYAAAVASLLGRRVWSVERNTELAVAAAERLRRLGFANVRVAAGDAAAGWAEHAPYDAIVSAAAASDVPAAWIEQLAEGGRIVAPLGTPDGQQLVRIEKTPRGLVRDELLAVRYVPLIVGDGREGLVELP
jgi:protein-L-isoaspartate(D-aspartate) O-methyltransferase